VTVIDKWKLSKVNFFYEDIILVNSNQMKAFIITFRFSRGGTFICGFKFSVVLVFF
jgi:hypothetical protein